MTFAIQRIRDLPIEELAEMLTESKAAGFRAIDRLIQEWRTETTRFERPGEALFMAKQSDRIIGVCGLTCDPYINSISAGRVRRLYVMQASRRQGVGQRLVDQIIQAAKPSFDRLQVRTTSSVAAQFYQSLGFTPCQNEWVTHVLQLN